MLHISSNNKVNTHCAKNVRFPALIRTEWFSLVMLDSGQVRTFEEVATAKIAALPAASEEVHIALGRPAKNVEGEIMGNGLGNSNVKQMMELQKMT